MDKRDLSLNIDGEVLNIRVGVIMRHGGRLAVEISKIGLNSTIPGGRIRMREHSRDAAIREISEEMAMPLDSERLVFVKVMEQFFVFQGINVHELLFLYRYELTDSEAETVCATGDNLDGGKSKFALLTPDEAREVNLLPLEVLELI